MVSYKDNIYFYQLLSGNKTTSGVVEMSIPVAGEDGTFYYPVVALLEDNIRIKTENKWGTLVPTLDSLSQVSQLLGSSKLVSWVNGSSAAWESTQPIDVSFQMRLITFTNKHDILMQMAMLQSLTALRVDGALTVEAHGGYRNNFWNDNKDIGKWYDKDKVKKELSSKLEEGLAPYGEEGTVSVKFGNLTISNLLTTNISAQVSKVLCRNLQPLWIKIDISLRGVRALLTQDLQKMVPNSDILGVSSGISVGEDLVDPNPKPKIDPKLITDLTKIPPKIVNTLLNPLNPVNMSMMTNPVLAPVFAPMILLQSTIQATMLGVNSNNKKKNSSGGGW